MAAFRTPVTIRKAVLDALLSTRASRLRQEDASRAEGGRPPAFITWPPASNVRELRDLARRVRWFLPPLERDAPVLVPVTPARLADAASALAPEGRREPEPRESELREPEPRDAELRDAELREPELREPELEPLSVGAARTALRSSAVALLWKARSWRLPHLLLARQTPFFIVDPTLYASTEESEWMALYARYASDDAPAALSAAASAGFARLAADVGANAAINVCGNGPNLEQIFAHDSRHDVTIVCNSAVRVGRLLAHTRPKAIAFVNSPYFGPSEFARHHMARVARCVEDYGSFILIPDGYAHHLLRTHYPSLASHIVALRFGQTLRIPAPDDLSVQASANVLTSLMLPLAAALKPRLIRLWGCDGQPEPGNRAWRYLPGLEPRIESVAGEHPAFVEGLRTLTNGDQYFVRAYETHSDRLEQLLTHLEGQGLRVVCVTPTAIPSLARRTAASIS